MLSVCVAGSIALHALLLTLLPEWRVLRDEPAKPLIVELTRKFETAPANEPPLVLPQALPMPTQPQPRERPKPAPVKPAAVPTLPRAAPPPEVPRAPILAAPSEAPVSASSPVVPEVKPAPPPLEPPLRARVAPAPVPVTPPRSDAAHLANPPPNYPLAARRRGDHGTVQVRLIVTAEGLAKNVTVEKSSGHPALDEAAMATVRNWRFVPARQEGKAIDWPYTQSIHFKLE